VAKLDEEKLLYIFSLLKKINFGSVTITIHNDTITQVDHNEKFRLIQK
jgi:hypothetical protein